MSFVSRAVTGMRAGQEDISPYEIAITALNQGNTRLSQEHSENLDTQGLSENEKSVARAVDPKRLGSALISQKGPKLPSDPEVSEAINRARKNEQ